jgi:DSF synthase
MGNFTLIYVRSVTDQVTLPGGQQTRAMKMVSKNLLRSDSAGLVPSSDDSRPIRFPKNFDIRSAHFDELELRLEEESQILWCNMRPSGRPSYTHELMGDIGSVQAAVRQVFADRKKGEPAPFHYFVCGSSTPGIYNLGGDLRHFIERIREQDFEAMRRYAHVAVERQYENSNAFGAPIITIALVKGDALGGGFEHALSLDVIVAERSAKMGLPEVLFNLFPGMGAYSFISRRLDRRAAEKFIMSGRVYSGEELYELGIVDVLAEDGEGEDKLREYVAQHSRRFNMHRAVYEARRRVNPVTLQELLDVVDLWAETAMNLDERDLRIMERLCAAQDRRVAGARGLLKEIS